MHSIDDIRDKRTDQLARGFPVANAETQEIDQVQERETPKDQRIKVENP